MSERDLQRALLHLDKAHETDEGVDLSAEEVAALCAELRRLNDASRLRAPVANTEALAARYALEKVRQVVAAYARHPRCDQHDGALVADNTLGIGDLTIGDLRALRSDTRGEGSA